MSDNLLKDRTFESTDGRIKITISPFDELFKADVLDTQITAKGPVRKRLDLIYLCVDEGVVSVTVGRKGLDSKAIHALNHFDTADMTTLSEISALIDTGLYPTEEEIKK